MILMKIKQTHDGYCGETFVDCPYCGKKMSFYSILKTCRHCDLSLPDMRALKLDINYRIQWHRSA